MSSSSFSQHFEMKDLDSLSYFLGLEVSHSSYGYFLTQAKYGSDLLSRIGHTNCKTANSPIESNLKLRATDGEPPHNVILYRQLVGSLIYLTVTQPNFAYAVHLVSQFMTAPHSIHYVAVLRILHYVKGTLFYRFHFSSHSSPTLHAYSDADWTGDSIDQWSITGFLFLLALIS